LPAAAKETVESLQNVENDKNSENKEVVLCVWATLQDFLSAVNVIGVGSALHLPLHSICRSVDVLIH
jgi:hypothetical protein